MSAQRDKLPRAILKSMETCARVNLELRLDQRSMVLFCTAPAGASPWFSRTGSWSWPERCCCPPDIWWWCCSPEPGRRASAGKDHLQEHQRTVRRARKWASMPRQRPSCQGKKTTTNLCTRHSPHNKSVSEHDKFFPHQFLSLRL